MPTSRFHWRVVDIVTASVLAVVCGLIFWVWSASWSFIEPLFLFFPPAQGLLSGTWVLAGPLAGLIIRKPGAAIYAEVLAAVVEAVLGSHFGFSIFITSPIQGLAAELAFAIFAYRRYGFWVTMLAGLLTGIAQGCIDNIVYYAAWEPAWRVARIAACGISGLVMAGLFVWWITGLLARTGALNAFTSGRDFARRRAGEVVRAETEDATESAGEAATGESATSATAQVGSGARGSTAPSAVQAIDFGWRHAGRKRAAFSHLNLEIPAGQKVLIAGASGAGKSTLLHALAGVLPAESGYTSGRLLVDGAVPDPTRGTTGLVLQDPDSQAVMSKVGHDVAFGLENLRAPVSEIPARVRRALDLVGLDQDLDHPTTALSGGQKQRLAIAGVVAMAPGLLVLDEPTANLDPEAAVNVRDVIVAAARDSGATVVLVEHRLPLWADHVDRIVVLGAAESEAAGTRIIADGTPDELLGDPAVRTELTEAGLWLPETDGGSGGDARPDGDADASPASSPLLTTHDLVVGRGKLPVANVPDLTLTPGTVVAVRGPNGVGKTTTALTLAGLLPPLGGEVTGRDALLTLGSEETGTEVKPPRSPEPIRWSSRELVARIGMVFQEPEHQFLMPTVRGELEFGPRRAGWDDASVESRVDDLLRILRLEALAPAHPNTLSGGEKRRLSVAGMIAAAPPLLIVDEPTFGQDAKTWHALVELFRELIEAGTAVVAVTHDAGFASAIGARTVHVHPVEAASPAVQTQNAPAGGAR